MTKKAKASGYMVRARVRAKVRVKIGGRHPLHDLLVNLALQRCPPRPETRVTTALRMRYQWQHALLRQSLGIGDSKVALSITKKQLTYAMHSQRLAKGNPAEMYRTPSIKLSPEI